jgi:hypothetical protein
LYTVTTDLYNNALVCNDIELDNTKDILDNMDKVITTNEVLEMPSPLSSWLTGAHLVGATEASCPVFSEGEEVCKSLARNHLSLIGFFLIWTGWTGWTGWNGWRVGAGAAGTSGWAGGSSGRGWVTG